MGRGWGLICGLVLLLSVCAGSFAAVAVDPVEVIYYQDFSSGVPTYWDTTLTASAERWVGEGEYHVIVRAPYHLAHGLLLQRSFRDGCFAVDVTQREGSPHASYGLVFRFHDPGNYYRFSISGDGYFELVHCQAGRCGYMIYRKRCYVLQLGCGLTNRLELVAEGCRLTCFLNGARLAEISDRCFTSGSIGVFVETLFSGGVHVAFDNVTVTELDP